MVGQQAFVFVEHDAAVFVAHSALVLVEHDAAVFVAHSALAFVEHDAAVFVAHSALVFVEQDAALVEHDAFEEQLVFALVVVSSPANALGAKTNAITIADANIVLIFFIILSPFSWHRTAKVRPITYNSIEVAPNNATYWRLCQEKIKKNIRIVCLIDFSGFYSL